MRAICLFIIVAVVVCRWKLKYAHTHRTAHNNGKMEKFSILFETFFSVGLYLRYSIVFARIDVKTEM